MRDYTLPRLGRLPVDAVTGKDVMDVLQPIWTRVPETARRVRRRIAIMKWAVAQGHSSDKPGRGGDLPGAAERQHTAHPPARAGARGSGRRRREGAPPGRLHGHLLSFVYLVLTACRSAEDGGVTWDEIDLEAAVWTNPARRTKAGG